MKKLLLLAVLLPFSLCAQPFLDHTFGSSGQVTATVVQEQSRAEIIIPLPEGGMLVGGNSYNVLFGGMFDQSWFVRKLKSNGDTDASFGNEGTVFYPGDGNNISWFFDMKLQPDGKILIAARVSGNYELRRLNANGTPDVSFANEGIASVDNIGQIGLLPDGKIIATGQYFINNTNIYSFRRFNTNGSIDTTFGTDGIAYADVTVYDYDMITQLAIQPDGKFLITGNSYYFNNKAVLSRFTANGFPDATFGTNGVVLAALDPESGDGYFGDVALQPDGKIVTCGYAIGANGTAGFSSSTPVVVRYNTDGTPDTSFGTNGIKSFPTVYNANDQLDCLKIQPDGKILAGGRASYPFPYVITHFYLVRLNADGTTDTTFGPEGRYINDFSGGVPDRLNTAADIELQADGNIVATGISGSVSATSYKMLVCRFKNAVSNTGGVDPDAITIYPNPGTDKLFIKNYKAGDIKIFSLNGQLVQEIKNNTFTGSIDISQLQTGIYIITVTDGARKTVKKFVKV